MKRSEINKILMQTEEFLKVCKFNLPEWAFWDITAWKQKKDDISHILQSNLGWDITDFGSNDFSRRGLFLFTLRNGMGGVTSKKPYAEKVLVVKVNQETPQHRHALKREDIINRNGGDLIVQVWNALPDNTGICSVSDVSIAVDSVYRIVPAGGRVVLKPGQSVYLENHHYHSFFAEKETVLAGEVSMVNDDSTDNYFADSSVGRFSEIEEDCLPYRLMVNDYSHFLSM